VGSWQVSWGLLAAVPGPAAATASVSGGRLGRLGQFDVEVVDVGFISDAIDAGRAAERLEAAGCDLVVCFLTTYMTST